MTMSLMMDAVTWSAKKAKWRRLWWPSKHWTSIWTPES